METLNIDRVVTVPHLILRGDAALSAMHTCPLCKDHNAGFTVYLNAVHHMCLAHRFNLDGTRGHQVLRVTTTRVVNGDISHSDYNYLVMSPVPVTLDMFNYGSVIAHEMGHYCNSMSTDHPSWYVIFADSEEGSPSISVLVPLPHQLEDKQNA